MARIRAGNNGRGGVSRYALSTKVYGCRQGAFECGTKTTNPAVERRTKKSLPSSRAEFGVCDVGWWRSEGHQKKGTIRRTQQGKGMRGLFCERTCRQVIYHIVFQSWVEVAIPKRHAVTKKK